MFITAAHITNLFAGGGGGLERGGHVLRETTSRGQCELQGSLREGSAHRALMNAGILCETRRVCVCVFIALVCVCFITAGPISKLFAWGEEESGGHVL